MFEAYEFELQTAVETKPHLQALLTSCVHCSILFFTDPRNKGRDDLRCPFGCREAHRRKCSNERSTAYYQDEDGRKFKKIQNAKRGRKAAKANSEGMRESTAACEKTVVEKKVSDSIPFDWSLVSYVQMSISLIEGRAVSRSETKEMLRRVLRQHSMVRENRMDYVVRVLNETPP